MPKATVPRESAELARMPGTPLKVLDEALVWFALSMLSHKDRFQQERQPSRGYPKALSTSSSWWTTPARMRRRGCPGSLGSPLWNGRPFAHGRAHFESRGRRSSHVTLHDPIGLRNPASSFAVVTI